MDLNFLFKVVKGSPELLSFIFPNSCDRVRLKELLKIIEVTTGKVEGSCSRLIRLNISMVVSREHPSPGQQNE